MHQQFASLYFQKRNTLEFEEHLTKAVLCPFTMGGAQANFQQYWSVVTSDPRSTKQATQRYQKHVAVIQKAVQEAIEEENRNKSEQGLHHSEL